MAPPGDPTAFSKLQGRCRTHFVDLVDFTLVSDYLKSAAQYPSLIGDTQFYIVKTPGELELRDFVTGFSGVHNYQRIFFALPYSVCAPCSLE